MKKILVVEDNPDNMELIKQILEDEGYIVMGVCMAKQGFELLQQQTIDLVVMDVSLPQMDGYEATRHIRSNAEYQELPIIAVTANAMQKDYDSAMEAGCNVFISKPLDEAVLVETVRGFFDKR